MRLLNKDRRTALKTKRLFDILLASTFIIIFLPLILLACTIILITSGWPVIISLERIGLKGRPFRVYKIRTMINGAQHLKGAVYRERQRSCEGKLPNDPRIIPLGKILRCSSIDELPQLWNVIKGNMSLVGPRPQEVADANTMPKYYSYINEFSPGMTGLAQVYGRGKLSYAKQDWLNGWYAKIWNLKLDLVILVKTFIAVLKRDGAM